MKGLKNSLLLITLIAVFSACEPANEKDAAKITASEDALFAADEGYIDKDKALNLVDQYVAYADNYPDDSLSAEYIFKGAEFCLNLGEGQRAVVLYDRVISEYPDFRKAPECLFLKAYVYENYLGDLEMAKTIYTEFLERYPNNEFADDAQISITNLGKTPEELIQLFEEQQSLSQDPE